MKGKIVQRFTILFAVISFVLFLFCPLVYLNNYPSLDLKMGGGKYALNGLKCFFGYNELGYKTNVFSIILLILFIMLILLCIVQIFKSNRIISISMLVIALVIIIETIFIHEIFDYGIALNNSRSTGGYYSYTYLFGLCISLLIIYFTIELTSLLSNEYSFNFQKKYIEIIFIGLLFTSLVIILLVPGASYIKNNDNKQIGVNAFELVFGSQSEIKGNVIISRLSFVSLFLGISLLCLNFVSIYSKTKEVVIKLITSVLICFSGICLFFGKTIYLVHWRLARTNQFPYSHAMIEYKNLSYSMLWQTIGIIILLVGIGYGIYSVLKKSNKNII